MATLSEHVTQQYYDEHRLKSVVAVQTQAGPGIPLEDLEQVAIFADLERNPFMLAFAKQFWMLCLQGKVAGVAVRKEAVRLDGEPYVRLEVEYPEA